VEGSHTDPELLRRLLGNLLANAIRYTNRGQVQLSCQRNGDSVLIQVKDTGIGIPSAELQRIFDEFYQVDRGTQRPEGLGLGLSIVRRLAALLHCEVRVDSVLDEGTVFQIVLPRGELPDTIVPAVRAPAAAAGGRILVVDDEPAVAEATGLLLETEGFDVSIASCEREALDHVTAARPDIIVSDYHLRGGETGLKVVLAVRERLGASIPVVFVTGDTARSAVEQSQIENARLLSKPMRADELLALINTQISAQRH
jgi:two-component system CheB/CheR fusion protein